jgi:hypothetical protein
MLAMSGRAADFNLGTGTGVYLPSARWREREDQRPQPVGVPGVDDASEAPAEYLSLYGGLIAMTNAIYVGYD